MANDHPQRFVITGELNKFNDRYTAFKPPKVMDHLPNNPRFEYTYYVEGGGLDYLTCTECFPRAGEVEDNRRAPGA